MVREIFEIEEIIKMNTKTNKKTLKEVVKNLFKISVFFALSYVIMVFISHFSVYNSLETYKIKDSFDAMLFKTDVPVQFFIYFSVFVIITVLIALVVNSFVKKT